MALKFCWNHRQQFYFLALPAVIILAILSTLVTAFQPPEVQHAFGFKTAGQQINFSKDSLGYLYMGSSWQGFLVYLLLIFKFCMFSLYSVAWHRFYLMPKEGVKILECYLWKNRHWQFLWANLRIFLFVVPIGLIAFIVTLTSAILAPLVGTIMIILVIICYARFSMWLPAVALDEKLSLQEVLFLTKGNGGRLAVILILTGLITSILDGMATGLIAYASNSLHVVGSLTQDLLTKLALYIIMYAGIAVGVTALSVSYQNLTTAHKIHRVE